MGDYPHLQVPDPFDQPHISAHIERSSWGHLIAGTGGSHPEIVGTYMRIWGLSDRRQSPSTDVDSVLASSEKSLDNASGYVRVRVGSCWRVCGLSPTEGGEMLYLVKSDG
jgi:hypothetical protein